ncbi:hypothetical protein FRC00_006793 [Tulasnella sp. 408]|nr:hypothetical protein FRC00_006793 [Tulasnella sp. 408]
MSAKKDESSSVQSTEKQPIHDGIPSPDRSDVEIATFGTSVQFSKEEESALVRKLDWRIMPLVTILYLSNFIDRTNVGNAKVGGLEKDLGLVGYQYNIGLSIFFIFYALSEVPSNLILKHVGANIWSELRRFFDVGRVSHMGSGFIVPTIVMFFGFVTFITSWVKDFSSFMAIRVFLGIAEGGMMPGIAYFLSTLSSFQYYKRHELVLRVGIFVSASSMSGAFGGLLASGLLKIRQLDHLPHGRWRNIFLVEGAITMLLGIVAFFFLPGKPEDTKFLNERERVIATERLRVETAGLTKTEKTDFKLVLRAFTSVNNWLCGLGFLLCNIPTQGISLFMPTLLKGMGYGTIESQLRSVPPYVHLQVVACSWSIFVAYGSYRTQRRGIWVLSSSLFGIAGASILVGTGNKRADYAGLFLLAMGESNTFLLQPHTTRAVSSAMVVSIGTMGPIVSSWAYLPTDGPRYITGNSILIGAIAGLFITTTNKNIERQVVLILYNTWENKARAAGRRDWRLDADDETVAKLGHLHPRFRLTI